MLNIEAQILQNFPCDLEVIMEVLASSIQRMKLRIRLTLINVIIDCDKCGAVKVEDEQIGVIKGMMNQICYDLGQNRDAVDIEDPNDFVKLFSEEVDYMSSVFPNLKHLLGQAFQYVHGN